jgi:hypothetical protein
MLRNLLPLVVVLSCGIVVGAELREGLERGTAEVKSAGPLAFGPEGILFVGDTEGAAIFAIDTGDQTGNPSAARINVPNIDEFVAGMLGTQPKEIAINDIAVNPASGNVYLSVSRGLGPSAQPVILRVDGGGKVTEVSLKDVPFAKAPLPNAPTPGVTGEGRRAQNKRSQSITDLAYVDGRVFVAGLSNEEFESTLRSVPFPFDSVDRGAGVKIFHGAHGRFETESPVRTFTHYIIGSEPHLLAAYTCTPLVKFPVSQLQAGSKVQGTTVAELGNRNRPLDMFVYQKDGRDFALLANSARGVMKITLTNVASEEGITSPVGGGGTAGLGYETIENLTGIEQLDRLNADSAVVLVRTESGSANLQTIPLP